MRSVLVLAALLTLALAEMNRVIFRRDTSSWKFETVDADAAERQNKVLELLEAVNQVNPNSNYYKVGNQYVIENNFEKYKNPQVVSKFISIYGRDFLPRYDVFTIFNDRMREQAKALYDIFYYAQDFETFYNTAAWARVRINSGMFVYTFCVAIIQRLDTKDIVLPSFYELSPEFYINLETFNNIYYGRMRGEPFEEFSDRIWGVGNYKFYYQNYSDYITYGDEYKLSYLTEDIGWNDFYTSNHMLMPFWESGEDIVHGTLKERRGGHYYHIHQQLLSRYYMERLSNGMGEIPTFSWDKPFENGFRPFLTSRITPFAQRTDNYVMQNENNLDDLRYVRNYEDMFLSFLAQGQFSAFNKRIDFFNSKSINFVGNFWQGNPDLYGKFSPRRNYYNSYERAARRILGGSSVNYKHGEYKFIPSALDFYQTSLRDPAFYQIYNKIWRFMAEYKQNLPPHPECLLNYVGVEVNKLEVSKLETYFDFYVFNASNTIYYTNQELETVCEKQYAILQPRLNHESFTIRISVKSDVEEQASFKVFLGPKYDSYGNVIKLEDNWMNFVELDWFSQNLTRGENVITRNSADFFFYKHDSLSNGEIDEVLKEGKLPTDMMYNYYKLPKRLMLPRGTKSGFPLQIFVVVYPSQGAVMEFPIGQHLVWDKMPLGFPFDRPVSQFTPNMYMQDVVVYHRGSEYPTSFEVVYQHFES